MGAVKNYTILWEFFPNGRDPPPLFLGTPCPENRVPQNSDSFCHSLRPWLNHKIFCQKHMIRPSLGGGRGKDSQIICIFYWSNLKWGQTSPFRYPKIFLIIFFGTLTSLNELIKATKMMKVWKCVWKRFLDPYYDDDHYDHYDDHDDH